MESESAPWPEYGNYDASFLACLRSGRPDVMEDDVVIRFTSSDVLALGQFFVLGMLKWVQSVQIATHFVCAHTFAAGHSSCGAAG